MALACNKMRIHASTHICARGFLDITFDIFVNREKQKHHKIKTNKLPVIRGILLTLAVVSVSRSDFEKTMGRLLKKNKSSRTHVMIKQSIDGNA